MGSGKKVTIGYKYYLGMHMILCHEVDEVLEIVVGERLAWSGNVTSSSRIFVDAPDLFGGEKKEGGVQGYVDVAMGESSQVPNGYLQGILGVDIPAFRGVLSLILNQVYVTAMSRFPKPWACKVRRAPAKGWYDAKARIPGQGSVGDDDYIPPDSANPAHAVYECLTHSDWGLGIAPSLIDPSSFASSADILYDENLGISLLFTSQSTVEDFIQTIIVQVGAVMYTSRSTGLFTLKLIREPTTEELNSAKVFNEENISELVSFERPSFAEMINEVVLKYRPQGTLSDSAITVQDLSSIGAELGVVSQTVNFPGIDNLTIASRIAQRELKQYSTPLAKVRMIVNRDGWDVNPGDVINFEWSELGIESIVMRVFSVNYGTVSSNEITIDCTEDIFSLPSSSYLSNQGSEWVEPVRAPEPAVYQKLYELPYWHVANDLTVETQNLVSDTSAFIQMVAQKDFTLASASYQVWYSPTATPDGSYIFEDDSVYTPVGLLSSGITRTQTVFNLTGISPDVRFVQTGSYAYIGDEAVRIDGFVFETGQLTVARGALDTVPVVHAEDEVVYFADDFFNIVETEFLDGEEIFVKPLVQTDIALLDIADASYSSAELVARQAKPYPPSQVKFNALYFPEVLNALTAIPLTWKYQDRLLQIVNVNSWFESNQGSPEEGATFFLQFFNENDVLEYSIDYVGSAFTYTVDDEKMNSGLTTLTTDRVLLTAGLAVAVENVIYDALTDPSLGSGDGCVFRRMGADWVALSIKSDRPNAERYFINGATGVITNRGITRSSWIATSANRTVNALGVRSDADFIAPNLAGTQPNWAVLANNLSDPLSGFVAVDFRLQDCIDHRESASNTIAFSKREDEVIFVANGFSQQKRIFYTGYNAHVMTRAQLESTSNNFPTTVTNIDSFFSALPNVLDAANVTALTYPELVGNLSFFTIFGAEIYKTMAFGEIVYVTYRGRGTTSFTTLAKTLNVTNVLNAHLPTVFSDTAMRTDRFTIGATSLTLIDSFQGLILSDRSNVADTEGIQWKLTGSQGQSGSAFEIVDSSTGGVSFTSPNIFAIAALAVDWVNEFIYVIRQSDRRIHKINYAGTLIANIAFPTGSAVNVMNCNLGVSSDKVYLYSGVDAKIYFTDKDLVASWSLTSLAAKKINNSSIGDWVAYARPDSSLIYNYTSAEKHTLFDENGGQSPATPTADPRQSSSMRVTIRGDRGEIEGFQTLEHTIQRSGYGYNYGNYYGA